MSRRGFLGELGGSIVGLSVAGLSAACADGSTAGPADDPSGEIRGSVVNSSDEPEPVGRIFLMHDSGRQTGRYVDVDDQARFRFANVAAGNYQLRYHAPGLARVSHGVMPNPVRVEVRPDEASGITFHIERGVFHENMIEIYAGDDFFQEQPFGDVNGTTVVEQGTIVCWYNVGRRRHNVVGRPWDRSDDLAPKDSFIWQADQTGEFPYQCDYHQPQMRAVLRVIE